MLSIPRLQLHLTERCNLACTYCYLGHPTEPREMSLETGQRAIEFYLDHLSDGLADVIVSFFGGEPLIKFSLITELVPFARAQAARRGRTVHFSITTNGSAINATIAAFLKDNGFTTLISWDGDVATQNVFRLLWSGKGSGDLMRRAQPHILSLSEVGVRMTWSAETLPRLAANVRYFVDLGIEWLGFAPLDNLTFTDQLLARYAEQLDQIVDLWCEELAAGRLLYFNPLLKMTARVMDPRRPLHFHMHACDPLHGRVSVAHDGRIYGCHRFLGRELLSLGSVYADTLDTNVMEAFARFNRTPLNGCLAMLTPRVHDAAPPRHPPDFIRMMEVTLAGSERLLHRGVAILDAWEPERIPDEAKRLMAAYRRWSAGGAGSVLTAR
jgi:uncharacterized protein